MQLVLLYRYRRTEPTLDEHELAFWPGGIDDEVPVSTLTQRQYKPPFVFQDDEILPFWPGGIDDEVPVSTQVQRGYRPAWVCSDDEALGFTQSQFSLDEEIPWIGARQVSYAPPSIFQDDEQLGFTVAPLSLDEDFPFVGQFQRQYTPPYIWTDDEQLGYAPPSFGLEDELPWIAQRQASYTPPIVWTDDEINWFTAPPPPVDDGVPAPIGHPVYYVKGRRKKPRHEGVFKDLWNKVVAEVTAPVPKAGETVQPAAKVILPLIAAAPVESVSLASLSAELAEVRKKVELLEDEEELITILALGGYI